MAQLTHKDRCIDFSAYYGALRWSAETGKPPYQPWQGNPIAPPDSELAVYSAQRLGIAALQFLYPPSAILTLRPFTWIAPLERAVTVWRLFNLGVFLGILLVAGGFAPSRRGICLKLALLAGAYGPLRQGMWIGQVQLWVALLLLVFVACLRRGRGAWAGVALGMAASLKVFPILWAPAVFLYPRAWRRFGIALAATLALNFVFSAALCGLDAWAQYFQQVFLKLTAFPPGGTISLYAWLSSEGTAAPGMADSVLRRGLFFLAYVPAVAWLLSHAPRSGAGRRRALLMLTATVHLATPLTWEHYLAFFGVLAAIEISHLVPHGIRRFPCTTALWAVVFGLTGGGWLVDWAGIERSWIWPQAGLVAAFAVPGSLWVDIQLRRMRYVCRRAASTTT